MRDIYELDITHYVSLPGFSFDSLLKTTKAKLEQPSDAELYHILRKNVRGGFTTVVQRHAVANTYHINSDFNPETDTQSHIVHFDNNSHCP